MYTYMIDLFNVPNQRLKVEAFAERFEELEINHTWGGYLGDEYGTAHVYLTFDIHEEDAIDSPFEELEQIFEIPLKDMKVRITKRF